ncbi:hypothetical protein [Dietzia sp. MNB45]|uniref:hypothetical protein n=1 Tax=Dietzia sp. MNB45 TaxID=3238800 RepID=UPI003F80D426
MVAVYIDDAGDVRSAGSDRIVAPAGTTPREARMRAALWAAAADALQNPATAGTAQRAEGMPAVAAPTPITAAPSYARTVPEAREVLAVIDVNQLRVETEQSLALLAEHQEGLR